MASSVAAATPSSSAASSWRPTRLRTTPAVTTLWIRNSGLSNLAPSSIARATCLAAALFSFAISVTTARLPCTPAVLSSNPWDSPSSSASANMAARARGRRRAAHRCRGCSSGLSPARSRRWPAPARALARRLLSPVRLAATCAGSAGRRMRGRGSRVSPAASHAAMHSSTSSGSCRHCRPSGVAGAPARGEGARAAPAPDQAFGLPRGTTALPRRWLRART